MRHHETLLDSMRHYETLRFIMDAMGLYETLWMQWDCMGQHEILRQQETSLDTITHNETP